MYYKLNINLNIQILRLPLDLMDYVILHELAHTKIQNHGPKFWSVLQNILPNAKQLDRHLKDFALISF